MSKKNNTISTIQEFTLRSKEKGIFDKMFNDMNMSRPDIFAVLKKWADEFEEDNKYTDWAEEGKFFYDEVDKFLDEKWDAFQYLVDENGNPYIQDESWPAGGGLDKRCDYNKEALHAFDNSDGYAEYLDGCGFRIVQDYYPHMETWERGNTRIVLESRINCTWGYIHTEFIG
jgi:hypothetical protein